MNTKLLKSLKENCIPMPLRNRIYLSWAVARRRAIKENLTIKGYYCITKQNIWEYFKLEQYEALNDKSMFKHAFYVERLAKK